MWIAKRLAGYAFAAERNCLHEITKQVKDVVKLRGLDAGEPYVVLEGRRVELPTDTFLANLAIFKKNAYCAVHDVHYNTFYPGTPVIRVLSGSFFIQINNDCYFVYSNEPLFHAPQSDIYGKTGGSFMIEPIVKETLRELEGVEFMERGVLHNHMMKNVIDNSDELKLDKIRYKELLKVVEAKVALLEEHIKLVEQRLRERAERRVKLFSTFVISQLAVLHYFIYFNLSWDIMEPVTVVLGNFDLLAAYYFFLLKGETYSPEAWKNAIIRQRRLKECRKQGIDTEKYEELLEIRDDLKMRLGMLSKNPLIVLETLERPFKIVDTR